MNATVADKWGGLDVLVNNAGEVQRTQQQQQQQPPQWCGGAGGGGVCTMQLAWTYNATYIMQLAWMCWSTTQVG
jgi:NAD(P)-dependent dehydrogenase (short-subunit alcohol dehydrogenase family)